MCINTATQNTPSKMGRSVCTKLTFKIRSPSKTKREKGFDFDEESKKKYKNMRWAKMLARVFNDPEIKA